MDESLTGTFYEVENTHRIDYERFESIVSRPDLGTVGFYIYGFLKSKYGIFYEGYQRSYKKMSAELKMSDKTLRNYIEVLERCNHISIIRKDFIMSFADDEKEANIYRVK